MERIVVIGSGMAGVAAAYHLAVRQRQSDVVLIDERDPLTLTSDKGTQGYRNWWPGPDDTMLRFVSRSIDIMEEIGQESGNVIRMSQRGYLFVTGDDAGVERLRKAARVVSAFGMGALREHPGSAAYVPGAPEGYAGRPTGADLLIGGEAVREFPYLTPQVRGALHVRRAGWMSAVALGSWMLARAVGAGARFVRGRVGDISTTGGRVNGVRLASGETIGADQVVIAAGPLLHEVGRMLGLELPVFHELHGKMTFRDTERAVARSAPFIIWIDGQTISWSAEERARYAASAETQRMLEPYPGGVHIRPVDGPHGDELYLIWTFEVDPRVPTWPTTFDPHYGEVLLRGAAKMVPAMARYAGHGARGYVDGGYYCKTRENRPLVGPLPVEGAYVLGALSGSGIMAAHAGAELVAAHVVGAPLPDYAKWFLPSRYDDPAYRALTEQWGALVGQL